MQALRSAKRSTARGGHVAKPSARVAKLLGILLVPAAVVATGLTVASASYSAFNSTTTASGGSFTTGSVILNNDASTNFLSLSNLKPGQLLTAKCVMVTSTGSLPSTIKLYTTGVSSDANTLAGSLNMLVEEGTATAGSTTGGACGGFTSTSTLINNLPLSTLAATNSFSNGITAWTSSGGTDTRAFRFTPSVASGILNSLQSATTSVGFTWEAQNS